MMGGGTVGIVEASNNPRFHPGDAVVGMGGWQRYSLSDGAMLRRSSTRRRSPIQAYLGALGMPGVTAWYGLNKIIAPKAGETVLVSRGDRRGRLGGRPARQARRRADGRRRRRRREMRLRRQGARLSTPASTTSRRSSREELKAALPDGIDGLFENVGGEPFQSGDATDQ